jgi:hypothetical protein
METKLLKSLLLAPVLVLTCLAFQESSGQASGQAFTLRQGQAVYITALRRSDELMLRNASHSKATPGNVERHLYYDHDLGAEKQVRNQIEKWRYFKVVDKASEADFVLLVHVDANAMEGVVLPLESYREFKDRFSRDSRIDFEALREAAHQRYLVGPFKIATLGRMSDRMVDRFREAVGKIDKRVGK